MASVKMNVSLDEAVATTLRRRAGETGKPISRYLGDLIEQEARRAQDELAEEGYRRLSESTLAFDEAAWPLAAELPWVWEEGAPVEAAADASSREDADA